uniref:Cytochrome c oxidase subunit 2 n=1 Tax=Paroligoneurus sp. QL-2014 TaxID=1491722 RepID=A0A0U1WEH0_9HYME|nr:cytochrome c oxidase subunit II [Paroligoneurus sp. QL-2014]
MSTWMMTNFQDSNSFVMSLMIYFHDFSLMILIVILMLILYIMFWFMTNLLVNRNILHNQLIEIVWTLIPMFILIFMVVPSLKILYILEDINNNMYMTIKILGHQWYWSYEYSDFYNIEFDSFMIKDLLMDKSNFRLLDVDNRLVLPYNFMIRSLISSMDVIHSWTIPSLGVKVDAMPGRINQSIFKLNRVGVFFGQCSEICGLNHSFMPIVLESANMWFFMGWLLNYEK